MDYAASRSLYCMVPLQYKLQQQPTASRLLVNHAHTLQADCGCRLPAHAAWRLEPLPLQLLHRSRWRSIAAESAPHDCDGCWLNLHYRMTFGLVSSCDFDVVTLIHLYSNLEYAMGTFRYIWRHRLEDNRLLSRRGQLLQLMCSSCRRQCISIQVNCRLIALPTGQLQSSLRASKRRLLIECATSFDCQWSTSL